ncbi:hypothetical protein ACWEOE_28855 [Amycolatopsis sp. NPDC004368]
MAQESPGSAARPAVAVPVWLLAVHSIVLGAGYLLGPDSWSSGGSFAFIRGLGVPIRVWGAAFLLAGLLLAVRRLTVGHSLAAFASVFWGLGLVVTIVTGEATGWGGPVHTLLLIAPVHGFALWQRSRARLADRRTAKR